MKTFQVTLLSALFAIIWCNCGQNENAMEVHSLKELATVNVAVVNSLGENISLIGLNPPKVWKNAVTVGSAPNDVLIHNDEVFVLNSTSNSLDVLDVKTWSIVREYSVAENEKKCNPWAMALTEDDKLLVTCYQSNELLLFDPFADQTKDPVPIRNRLLMPKGDALAPFDNNKLGDAHPQGVVVVGQKAYVTLTNLFEDVASQYVYPAGPGFVQVVDIPSLTNVKSIPLTGTNAVSIHRPPSGGDWLYVSCAANYDGTGIVAILDTNTDLVVSTVNTGGAPGRIWVDENQTAWVGDMLDGQLLRFSTKDGSILEPVVLCPSDPKKKIYDFISDVTSDGHGIIFAACFATDTVHIFNSSGCTCGQITTEVGDGPQSLLVLPQ